MPNYFTLQEVFFLLWQLRQVETTYKQNITFQPCSTLYRPTFLCGLTLGMTLRKKSLYSEDLLETLAVDHIFFPKQ